MQKCHLWNEMLQIGNPVLDGHYQRIYMAVEELCDFLALQPEDEEGFRQGLIMLRKIINELFRHFGMEEAFMRQQEYRSTPVHEGMHAVFVTTTKSQFMEICEQKSTEAIVHYLGILIVWMAVHIQECDKLVIRDEPLRRGIIYDNEDSFRERIATLLLEKMFKISIRVLKHTKVPYPSGKQINVKTIIQGRDEYIFRYRIDEKLMEKILNCICGTYLEEEGRQPKMLKEGMMLEIFKVLSLYAINALESDDNFPRCKSKTLLQDRELGTEIDMKSKWLVAETDDGVLELYYYQKML